jgi:hypothetical protein
MKEALKQIADLLQPVAALADRTPFEHSEVIQRCVDASEIALEALAQPAQEPVAWMRPSKDGYDSAFRDHSTVVRCTGNPWAGWVPLYTTPPQLEERNFCPRCGKRTADLTVIHTCTPPQQDQETVFFGVKDQGVKVSSLEFVTRVMGKEEVIGKPIFWAEWPSKEPK